MGMVGSRGPTKAERDVLRREMFGLGCPVESVVREMGRRWRVRPREAYRYTYGWSQDEVAGRFTAYSAGSEFAAGPSDRRWMPAASTGGAGGADPGSVGGPGALAVMTGVRIGEYERWPAGGRRPSVYVLLVLANVFGTSVAGLLDYQDHRGFPDTDRAVLAAIVQAACPAPLSGAGVSAVAGADPPSGVQRRSP